MGYLVAGLVIFVLLVVMGRGFKRPTWRIGSAVAAVAVFAAAAYSGLRGMWPMTFMLAIIGVCMAVSARSPRGPRARAGNRVPPHRPPPARERMSAREAREILGVAEDATVAEIQTAYKRLMIRVHPDNGGAPGLAVQLNAARDRLLKGPRP